MLAVVAGSYVLAVALEPRFPLLRYVSAFSSAAMVGGLADWFAITALFRRPLGLPIPHTGVIPRNKERVADSIARFITRNFLTTEHVTALVRQFDVASHLAAWLAQPETAAVLETAALRIAAYGVRALDDPRLRLWAQEAAATQLGRLDFSLAAGYALDMLLRSGGHRTLLEGLIEHGRTLAEDQATKQRITTIVAHEMRYRWMDWLKTVGISVDELVAKFSAEKLVSALQSELANVTADPEHPLKQSVDKALADLVEKLKTSPEFQAHGVAIRGQILARPEMPGYVGQLLDAVRDWAVADLQQPDARIGGELRALVMELQSHLAGDAALRDWINRQIRELAPRLVDEYREQVGQFIGRQVKAWDDRYLTEQVELSIGRDLQFIRLNGTLVGGAIGLAIQVLTDLLR